jgi:hypothetical protein
MGVLLDIDPGGKRTLQLYDKRDDFNFNFHTHVATPHYQLHMTYIYLNCFDIQGPDLHMISFNRVDY